MELKDVLFDIRQEVSAAVIKFPPMASVHEGYAILLEEVDELWEEVKKSPKTRDAEKIKLEAKQVAAMATRFLMDLT